MKRIGIDVGDVLALIGFACVEYGIGQWSSSAPWIVGGAIMMLLGVWPTLRKAKR